MSTTIAPAQVTLTSPLDAFLAKRGDAAKPADQQGQSSGQSEPGTGADQTAKAEDAASGKTDKKDKTAEELAKELSAQAKANLRLGKERAALQRQLDEVTRTLEEMKQRAAGTFVEPSEEQKKQRAILEEEFAKFEQRREQSGQEAAKEFGEDYVLSNIYMEESPFAKLQKAKPWIVQRVMSAEKPVHEAIAVLNEEAILTKFGRTEADVLKAAKELLRPVLFAEFLKEHDLEPSNGTGAKPAPRVPNLSKLPNAGGDSRTGDTVRTFSALELNPHNRL